MNEKKNDRSYKILLTVGRLFFIGSLAAICIFYFFFAVSDRKRVNMSGGNARLLTYWTGTDESGRKIKLEDGKVYPYTDDGTFSMSTYLPAITDARCYLAFVTIQDTEVFIDGVLRKDFIVSRDTDIPGGIVKPVFVYIPIYAYDSGRTATIVRHRYGNDHSVGLPEVLLGSMSDIYLYIYDWYGTPFMLDAVIFFSSIIIILVGIFLKYRMKLAVSAVYAGFAVLMTSAWMMTDSYYFPFAMGHNLIDGTVSYLLCLVLPLPYFAYLRSLQGGRYRKFYSFEYTLTIVNAIFWTVLHFTGIFSFDRALYYIDAVLIFMIASFFALLIKEIKNGGVKSYRFTAIGLASYVFFAMLEIVTILIPGVENYGNMLMLGLILLLAFAVIQQFDDFNRVESQKRHAIELSDAKTNFLASMSHEIRTPINSILGMNEMILRENNDPVIESYASTVQQSGKMLLSLVNDVLDFSKIEAGKFEINEAAYSLSSLISDVSAMASERCRGKNLDYTVRIAPNIPDGLTGDEFRIKQVLINFISNAVKYTPNGTVSLFVYGRYITDDEYELSFDVTDTGQGIKPEDIPILFDAFTRADMKTNRNIEGTGLGLAIVKNIVESMNGTVNVESKFTEGSTFSFKIPQKVVNRIVVPTDLESLSEAASKAGRGKRHVCDFTAEDARILAVDDNEPNLVIVRQFLKITKIKVDTAKSGTEAVAKCKENKYELLLLDHMMPDPDGIKTLKLIRTDAASQNTETPAVVLTANAVAGSRKLYTDAGFDDYLTKPLDSSALEETVKRFLPKELIHDINDPVKKEDITYNNTDDIIEFEAQPPEEKTADSSLVALIPGINYEAALRHTGGYEDILLKIMADIANGAKKKAEELRRAVLEEDFETYRLGVHSIKGTSATIGAEDISDMARVHENAVKEGNTSLVLNEYEAFLDEYESLCEKILTALK